MPLADGPLRYDGDTPVLIARILALTVAYYVSGVIGLSFADYHDNATLVWPPTGVALAALILYGVRLWPGIALGTLLVNATTAGLEGVASVGVAVGNTLEAVIGTIVLVRYAGFRPELDRVHDVIVLLVIGAVGCTVVSATIGFATLALTENLATHDPFRVWLIWWLGDAGGAIIMTPAILIAANGTPAWRRLFRNVEFLAAFGLVLGLSGWATIGRFGSHSDFVAGFVAVFTPFPLVVWAGIRTGSRGAMLVALSSMAIATIGMAAGVSPFITDSVQTSMTLLWVYNITIAATALSLANAIGQREQAQRRYRLEEAQRLRAERVQLLMRERERMTREMHDGVGGQLVSTISMLESGNPGPGEVIESLRRALDDMRIVIDSLDPSTTDLPTSLAKLRARLDPLLRRNGIQLNWQVAEVPGLRLFSPEASLHLLRIVQEAVTNALRHACAHTVTVEIRADSSPTQALVVEIRDDGRRGPPEAHVDGRGLRNMRTRADELGATLAFEPGAPGTAVRLRIDLHGG